MDNEQLLTKIESMFNEHRHETASMLEDQRRSIISEVSATIREQNQAMSEYIHDCLDELETRINFKIENDIEKRLDALTDGYKLTHEKQWELERKLEKVEARLAALEERIA